jgi:catechol 2,3-dioxygenase-like lactoylglutathione lyase family enzyme
MNIESLDHVALWVADRDRLADFLTTHVGMHEIERTDAFTLVGADARRGKLTLFAAEGGRERGPLAEVGIEVTDLDRALSALPRGLELQLRADGSMAFDAPEGLVLVLVEAPTGHDYDLHHLTLEVPDPASSFVELSRLGFTASDGKLFAAGKEIRLEEGGDGHEPERPLLNHIALRVESAGDHIKEAEDRGLEIADVKDAENTYAVFVWGPDRIKLEYVEHKASFSLV